MKDLKTIISIFILFVMASCSQSNSRPETALDTGRGFIRASLDGDFKSAESLLLNNEENIQFFDSYKRYYNNMSPELKMNYKKASDEILQLSETNDSTTIINYANSYMKKPMEIKVVRVNNEWWIDFKYTSAGDDTSN